MLDFEKERKRLRRRGLIFSSDEAPVIIPTGLSSHPPGSFATKPQSIASHPSPDQVPGPSAASPTIDDCLTQYHGPTPAGPAGPAKAGGDDENRENNKDDNEEDKPKMRAPGRLRKYLSRKSMFFRHPDPEPPVPH